MDYGRLRLLMGASASVIAVISASQVHAQTSDAASTQVGEVVVTGSRVVRDGMLAPTPVTVVTAQELIESRPLVSEALNDLPQVSVTTQRGSGPGSSGAGFAFVSLRNLGAGRTLVLLDGRRFVPSSGGGSVDTSMMPNNLLQRVDIVTGGASAAYGADAVAGVVNYVINTKFTGLKTSFEAGLSQRGDVPQYQGSIAYGTSLWGGRGHLLLGVEGYTSNGLRQYDREEYYGRGSENLITNPCLTATAPSANCPIGFVGGPRLLRISNARLVAGTPGGIVTAGPLKGLVFENNGATRQFNYGTLVGSTWQIGGEGDTAPSGNAGMRTTAVGWLDRANNYARFEFDATPKLNLFAENSLGWTRNFNPAGCPYLLGSTAVKVTTDNAFLPDSVRNQMIAAKVTSISVGKQFCDFPSHKLITRTANWRALAGGKYDFDGNWKMEAYYQHGWNRRSHLIPLMFDQLGAADALDAVFVPATGAPAGLVPGSIVCRSTLTNPKNGCIPLNPFGPSMSSPDAIKALTQNRTPWNMTRYWQDVVSATLTGDLFQLPAGPFSVAAGVEARWEKLTYISDPYSQIFNPTTGTFGGYRAGNSLPFGGDVNVKEYFAEANAPLLTNQPFAKSLELNLAWRTTDYSSSGKVNTWKIGSVWEPVEGLRFRVTRSRDIRAPTMQNLFQGGSQGTANLIDRMRNDANAQGVRTISAGNPDLRPEIANTLVYGVVYQPNWLPGLSLSVDRWDIKIRDSIASIANQTIIDQCFANPASTVCSFIVRDANGTLTALNNKPFNFAFANTDGIDFEGNIRRPMPSWMPVLKNASFNARLLATRVFHNTTQTPGEAPNENAGEIGNPKWLANLTVGVSEGPWKFSVTANYRDKLVFDNTYKVGVDINDNDIGSVVYANARIAYDLDAWGRKTTLSFSVDNIMDRAPPSNLVGEGNDYDVVGRYFRIGVDTKF